MKYQWRKSEKNLYLPKAVPQEVDLGPMAYFTIKGQGNPNSQEFKAKVEALYAVAYGVRMSH